MTLHAKCRPGPGMENEPMPIILDERFSLDILPAPNSGRLDTYVPILESDWERHRTLSTRKLFTVERDEKMWSQYLLDIENYGRNNK